MFAVIYRWKLKPGREAEFEEGWKAGTAAIAREFGGWAHDCIVAKAEQRSLMRNGRIAPPGRRRWRAACAIPTTQRARSIGRHSSPGASRRCLQGRYARTCWT